MKTKNKSGGASCPGTSFNRSDMEILQTLNMMFPVNMSSERCLMLKILLSAVRDFCLVAESKHRDDVGHLRIAEYWFYSPDIGFLYSFRNVCIEFDFDADRFLANLVAKRRVISDMSHINKARRASKGESKPLTNLVPAIQN